MEVSIDPPHCKSSRSVWSLWLQTDIDHTSHAESWNVLMSKTTYSSLHVLPPHSLAFNDQFAFQHRNCFHYCRKYTVLSSWHPGTGLSHFFETTLTLLDSIMMSLHSDQYVRASSTYSYYIWGILTFVRSLKATVATPWSTPTIHTWYLHTTSRHAAWTLLTFGLAACGFLQPSQVKPCQVGGNIIIIIIKRIFFKCRAVKKTSRALYRS